MVVVIQGLVILFTGAMEHMFRPRVTKMYTAWRLRRDAQEAV